MKPTLISKNRMKINISPDDLIRLNLSYDMLDYRDTRVRDVLNNIIDVASEQTGFNCFNEKILVEIVPLSGGGCTICVTRLPGKRSLKRSSKRQITAEPYIFRFSSLDNLISAGNILNDFSDIILGSLNVIYRKNQWHLSFAPVIAGLDSFRLDFLLGKISEFGEELEGGKTLETALIEHGETVARDKAAEKMFAMLK